MADRKKNKTTMRTQMPNPRLTPRYAGIATFCRFPRLEEVDGRSGPVDWVVYGAPFDGGVTYRSGARFGPRAIRGESQYVKPYHLWHKVNVAEVLSVADGGDSPVMPFDAEGNAKVMSEFAGQLGEAGHTKLLAVGGDHSIAYANMKATWMRAGKPKGGLAVLHMDAHLDTVDEISGSRWTHGSPFRRAHEEGLIDMGRMLSVGIRGPMNSAEDLEYGKKHGAEIVTCDEARTAEGGRRIARFVKELGARAAYLSFDIDCVDPAFAPGTGTPVCGGFTSAEVLEVVRGFRGVKVAGADVVEVLPERDCAGITALLAGHMIMEILALAASGGDRNRGRL